MRTRHAITSFAYEKAFQNVYTDEKFVEIQEQCTRLMYLSVVGKREVSDSVVEHLVQDRVWFFDKVLRKEIPMDRKRVYSVTFNSETNDAFCECKLFECHGIMCSHQFEVFDDNGVKEVPSKYILRRGRKDVHRCHTWVKVAYHDPSKTDEVKRYDRLMVQFENVCLKAASRPEYVKIAFDAIRKLYKALDDAIMKDSGTDTIQKDVECDNTGMESSPSVNKDFVEKDFVDKDSDSVMLHNDLGDSIVNERSALGLDEISIDPVHNTPTPMELVPNKGGFNCGSSVNENISAGDGSVQKPLSVGDPISRKKPHRPRAKRFLSFAEKCAKKASSARTKTTTKTNNGNCGQQAEVNKGTKKRGRPRKVKE